MQEPAFVSISHLRLHFIWLRHHYPFRNIDPQIYRDFGVKLEPLVAQNTPEVHSCARQTAALIELGAIDLLVNVDSLNAMGRRICLGSAGWAGFQHSLPHMRYSVYYGYIADLITFGLLDDWLTVCILQILYYTYLI